MPDSVLPIFFELTLHNPADKSRLDEAIGELQSDFAACCSIILSADTQTITIHSICDDYLDVFFGVIRDKFSIPVNAGAPQIVYRRTIAHNAKADFTHKLHSRKSRQFAQLILHFEPMPLFAGALFKNATAHSTLLPDFVTAIAEGLAEAKECGTLDGIPYTDFMATLTHATYNEYSSPEAFAIAARMAFRQGIRQAQPVLLEPIMNIEVMTPEDFLGDVIGDLNSRRGTVQSMNMKDDKRCVVASVPLSSMFGYRSKLRSKTQGRADCKMGYSHYEPVPTHNDLTPPDGSFPAAVGMRQVPYTFTKLDGCSGNPRNKLS